MQGDRDGGALSPRRAQRGGPEAFAGDRHGQVKGGLGSSRQVSASKCNADQELALSFGSLTSSLSLSDIGSWMLMPLGGIGFSNHLV
jgi:hypothetical protein